MARIRVYPAPTLRTITLASMIGGAIIDNGTAGNGTPTESGGYVTIPAAGSKTIASTANPDPDDAAVLWWAHQIVGPRGEVLTTDGTYSIDVAMDVQAALSTGDNWTAFAMISNEADPRSATIKGLIASLEATASVGNPRCRLHTISAGTVANALNGTATASIRGMRWACLRLSGAANNALIPIRDVVALDSTGARMSAGSAVPAATGNGNANIGTGPLYLLGGIYRTLVTDTDAISPAVRWRYAVGPTS